VLTSSWPFVKIGYSGGAAVATRMPSMTEPSGYMLDPLREGPDFTLYRGRQHGNPYPVLVVALTAEQPSLPGAQAS